MFFSLHSFTLVAPIGWLAGHKRRATTKEDTNENKDVEELRELELEGGRKKTNKNQKSH